MDIHKLLDQLDEIIYISDPETNELLFLNRCGRNKFGALTPGVKCYEHLQGAEAPCSFCTNGTLQNCQGHRITWVRQHPTVGNMLLHDSRSNMTADCAVWKKPLTSRGILPS